MKKVFEYINANLITLAKHQKLRSGCDENIPDDILDTYSHVCDLIRQELGSEGRFDYSILTMADQYIRNCCVDRVLEHSLDGQLKIFLADEVKMAEYAKVIADKLLLKISNDKVQTLHGPKNFLGLARMLLDPVVNFLTKTSC